MTDPHFYPPTVLAGVKPGMRIWTEEVFGPVIVAVSAGVASKPLNPTPQPPTHPPRASLLFAQGLGRFQARFFHQSQLQASFDWILHTSSSSL